MKPTLLNNLKNVDISDTFYYFADIMINAARDVLNNVPREVRERMRIVAGDSFFTWFSYAPAVRERNSDEILEAVRQKLSQVLRTQEFAQRHVISVHDYNLSMVYGQALFLAFAEELAKKLEEQRQQSAGQGAGQGGGQQQGQQNGQGQSAGGQQQGAGQQNGQGQQGQGQGQQNGQPSGQGAGFVTHFVTQVVRAINAIDAKAVAARAAAVGDAVKSALEGLLPGGKDAGRGHILQFLAGLVTRVYAVSGVSRIIAYAAKSQDIVPLFTRLRKTYGKRGAEVSGIRRTARVEEAIPREYALDDDVFMAKLASGALAAREYATLAEGAYYVLLDKSGSMRHAEKTEWSRSVALALLKLAKKKKRKYFMRFFDDYPHQLVKAENENEVMELLNMLTSVASDGDTDIAAAIMVAAEDLKQLKQLTNTIVIITDGEDSSPRTRRDEIVAALKSANATLIAVMVGGHNAALKELAEASGGVYLSVRPDAEGALKIVEAAKA